MLGHRALNVQDYAAILRKRWWIIVLPMILFAILGFVATFFVQPKYVSQTLVLIEQQKIPEEYVKAPITEDLNSRLASMQEQILSRSRLQPIVERFNLYSSDNMDARIDKMRKDITIKLIQSEISRTNGLPGFYISFTANDPHTAQSVCGEITTLFVNQNLQFRARSVEGTTDFLKGQLDDAKRSLDDQDAKLAQFQRENMGKLPGDEASSLSMLTALNTQYNAANQAIENANQKKSYMQAILTQQVNDWKSMQSSPQRGGSGTASHPAGPTDLQQMQAQLDDLRSRYTEDYPDVVALKRKIAELKLQQPKTPAPAASDTETSVPAASGPEPDSIVQLRAQLRVIDQEITGRMRDQSRLQAQMGMYQERIQSSPAVLEQYKALTRDYQTAQTNYDDLLKRMNQSKMASDLEKQQQGEQFRVMDAPNLPDAPTFPNRAVFFLGGLMFGAVIGLLVIAALEYGNTEIRCERDIWAFTKLPTLATIALTGDVPIPVEALPWKNWKLPAFGRRMRKLTSEDNPDTTSY